MTEWPLGKHPGDAYFMMLANIQRKLRVTEIKNLSKTQRVDNLIGSSWCRFINDKNKAYYYNFLTSESTEIPPIEDFKEPESDSKKERLKDLIINDDNVQEVFKIYDNSENFVEDKFFSVSNHILQNIINEDLSKKSGSRLTSK